MALKRSRNAIWFTQLTHSSVRLRLKCVEDDESFSAGVERTPNMMSLMMKSKWISWHSMSWHFHTVLGFLSSHWHNNISIRLQSLYNSWKWLVQSHARNDRTFIIGEERVFKWQITENVHVHCYGGENWLFDWACGSNHNINTENLESNLKWDLPSDVHFFVTETCQLFVVTNNS